MTPAEWLAAIILGSTVIGILRDLLDPNAINLEFNNNFWLFYMVVYMVTVLVLAFAVLV